MSAAQNPALPSLDRVTRIVARALGADAASINAAFQPATAVDLDPILALRRSALGEAITWDDRAYLRWRYRFGEQGLAPGDCWRLKLGDRLLAVIGTEELTLRWDGQEAPFIRLMDTLIDPTLADMGLGLWLNLAMQERHPAVLAVGSNANSRGLVSRCFQSLPDRRVYVRPIRFDRFMRRRMGPGLAARAASGAASAGYAALALARQPMRNHGHKTMMAAGVPQDIATLLASSAAANRVEVARSAGYYGWRLATPREQFKVMECRLDGRLTGLLLLRESSLDRESRFWNILDLVVDEAHAAAAGRSLLAGCLRAAARSRVEYVQAVMYRQDLEGMLRAFGFIQRPAPFQTMGLHCRDPLVLAALLKGRDWSFGEIHTDAL